MTENSFIDPDRCAAIRENLKRIREEVAEAAVRSGRTPDQVRLMAVTKTVDPAYINCAIDCGVDLIGENKVQEFLAKKDALHLDGVEKHLIGHLQSNKVRKILTEVDMIESVDSLSLAAEIERQCVLRDVTADVLIEVNVGEEASKSGLDPVLVKETVAQIAELGHLRIRGLMCIPPICEDPVVLRGFFDEMYQLFIDIGGKKTDNVSMDILSMGMSGDYREAILCGSNLVRVGSAIFGARVYAPKTTI